MTMREGWKCPNCGGAHGPHVDSCPVAAKPEPFQPGLVQPREWYPAPMTTGDPPPMWPTVTCGTYVCKADPNLIAVN